MDNDNDKSTQESSFKSTLSRLGKLNRDTSLLSPVRSAKNQGLLGFAMIADLSRGAVNVVTSAMNPGRTETFEEAMSRFGLREGDLARIHNKLSLEAIILYSMVWVSVAVATYFMMVSTIPSSALVALFVGFACFARAATCLFRAYQIRNRALGGLRQWASSASNWMPVILPEPGNEGKS